MYFTYNNKEWYSTFFSNISINIHHLSYTSINTLWPRQNDRHPDDILKCIFPNENMLISIEIPLKPTPKGPTNNIPALVETLAWCQPGDKPPF